MFIIIIFVSLLITSCNKLSESQLKDDCYNGIIVNKFRNEYNHNTTTFQIRTDELEFNEGAFLFPGAWDYADIGDSIIKKRGEMLIIIKKSDENYKSFIYR